MVTKSISHLRNHGMIRYPCEYRATMEFVPMLLRWCEMDLATIHSMEGAIPAKDKPFRPEGVFWKSRNPAQFALLSSWPGEPLDFPDSSLPELMDFKLFGFGPF